MTIIPMFPELESGSNDTPLPLLVAKKWDFPLAFHIVDGKYYYAIQDWLRGLTGESEVRKMWVKLKAQTLKDKLSTTSRQLPYRATNGKTYSLEFLTDNDLYVIAQYLRITKSRPSLDEIRQFLAKAGVFVDEVRLDPTKVLTSGAISPDQALEAGIEMYRAQGKSDAWIQMRVESKFKRDAFVKAL